MLTTARLSQRTDLLEGIHAEGVLCYLKRHGVLDPVAVASLGDKATARQINSAILLNVERQGQAALSLLINALRQSWQLQLASSLDPEPRIHPPSGNSYLGKHRHKGELTIKIQIEALRVNARENEQQVTSVDANVCQDLTSACRDFTTPNNVSHLHEEITPGLIEPPGLNTTSRSDDVDGASVKDDDDEDFVKPKSCWSFCLFRKKKSKSKKDLVKQKKTDGHKMDKTNTMSAANVNLSLSQNASDKKMSLKNQRRKLKEKSKVKKDATESTLDTSSGQGEEKHSNGKKLVFSKSDILERCAENKNGLYDNQLEDSRSLSQVHIRFGRDETAGVKPGYGGGEMVRSDQLDSSLGLRDSRRHNAEHFHNLLHQPSVPTNIKPTSQISSQETWHSVSTDYNHKLDLATVKANNNNLVVPSGNVMYQDLTSADKDFEHKASELCAKITNELQTEMIKYFEQEQGILVLDVAARDAAIAVVCICMARSHVRSLQQAVSGGGLLRKMEAMFAKVDTAMFEVQEVKLKIAVDDKEMCTVVGELA